MSGRTVRMHFRVSEKENEIIRAKMKDVGILSIGAYLRKMAIDGYCIRLDMTEIKEVLKLLRINSNNINQYVKKANETGSIYLEDVRDVQEKQKEIWNMMRSILEKLSEIS